MFRKALSLVTVLSVLVLTIPAQKGFEYPKARKADQVDDFHGVKVADPYRWMEDTGSAETQSWIEAQNKLTNSYFETIPQRARIRERLTELWNYERISAPAKIGKRYIYTRNDGLQNQSVLYITDSINDPGKVFFDPNKLFQMEPRHSAVRRSPRTANFGPMASPVRVRIGPNGE